MRIMRRSGIIRLTGVLLLIWVLIFSGQFPVRAATAKTGNSVNSLRSSNVSKAGNASKATNAKKTTDAPKTTSASKKTEKTAGGYKAPAFSDSAFYEDKAENDGEVIVDTTMAEEGYIGVSALSENILKVQIIMDDMTYTYDLASDGTPSIYPLTCGDGYYYYRVLENVNGTKYSILDEGDIDVVLEDEFQPFIRPSDYVNYKEKSQCVKKAAELAKESKDALDVVQNVFDYGCVNVKYDKEKAKTVQAGYLPNPDETLKTGKGICFDYAALAAAMLRSQGIPVKMVFGYVSPDDVYHAWNMFYTKETGWVAMEYEVDSNTWNRLDLTFSSGGAPTDFVGDGSNYTDVYYY